MELVASLLAGALIWSGFAPIEFPLGPFLGIFILFRILLDKSIGGRFLYVSLSGLAFFLPLLHWSSSYVGWIPWISLTLLQVLLFSSLALLPIRRNLSSVFLFAASFTVIEILRMKGPFGGFGWGRIGHTQVDVLPGMYSLVGVAGISFITVFFSALIVIFKVRSLLSFLIISVLSPFFVTPSTAIAQVDIAAVQGGVDELGLDYNQRALSVLKRHAQTSSAVVNKPDLIIWPENASDIDPFQNAQAKEIIGEVIEGTEAPLLVGAVLRDSLGPKNVSILFAKDQSVESLYIKQDLAPFGEYMPIRRIAEFITPEAKRVTDFQSGERWVSHRIGGSIFNSVICFEVLDDDFLRTGLKDSVFVVAQTNNATFGRSPQAQQQLQIIRARAAEFQRDFAVVSTTGFTAHVASNGSVVESLEQFEPGVLDMTIEARNDRSLASKIGSWFWVAVFLLSLLVNRRSVLRR